MEPYTDWYQGGLSPYWFSHRRSNFYHHSDYDSTSEVGRRNLLAWNSPPVPVYGQSYWFFQCRIKNVCKLLTYYRSNQFLFTWAHNFLLITISHIWCEQMEVYLKRNTNPPVKTSEVGQTKIYYNSFSRKSDPENFFFLWTFWVLLMSILLVDSRALHNADLSRPDGGIQNETKISCNRFSKRRTCSNFFFFWIMRFWLPAAGHPSGVLLKSSPMGAAYIVDLWWMTK